MKSLTFIEIDIDYCELAYGVGACTAVLGVDSTRKCFNTISTCAKREDLQLGKVTLRFGIPTDYLAESGIDCIPNIEAVSITPAVVSLGKDLGTRASVRVTFSDHRWADTGPGFDKYVSERDYDPFAQGTFWGKFRARQPYLRNRALRVIRGTLGQTLDQMETRHFIIDSFNGPGTDGNYSIEAKDVLKLLDGDRAQAPRVSQGFLTATLAKEATTATLNPAGIGNLEYPSSGFAAIGGKEIVAFTRSGDTLTLTRGQYQTEAAEHAAGDRIQLCLRYTGQDPADIIADLMENYGEVPGSYIPVDDWRDQTSNFLRRQYSALIAEPTSVRKLISELVEQAALSIWWDEVGKRVRLIVLRSIPDTAGRFYDENIIEGSMRIQEQPNSRISQIWTYFAPINPLKKVDDADNYRSIAVTVDAEAESDYGSPAIKKIFSRWIPAGGRQVAMRANDIQLGRFRNAPRRFSFELFRYASDRPLIGSGYQVEAWPLQTATGEPDTIPIQFVKVTPDADFYKVEAEELRFVEFDEGDLDNRVIVFDANVFNVNLRTTHDLLYPAPVSGDEVTCIIETGAIVGSQLEGVPAFVVGSWPSGVTLNLLVRGRIQGMGGAGGRSSSGFAGYAAAKPGGTALYARYPIKITVSNQIWGGGGGGGGSRGGGSIGYASGGGGAGFTGGAVLVEQSSYSGNMTSPQSGSPSAGGEGGLIWGTSNPSYSIRGGNGGGPGLAGGTGTGSNAAHSPGAAAGAAIDGDSFITFTSGVGDIRGPRVN